MNQSSHNHHLVRPFLFACLGSLLIICSTFLKARGVDWLEALLLNLGIVAIATIVIDYIWRLVGGTPMEQQISELASQIDRLERSNNVIEAIREVGLHDVSDRLGNDRDQNDWIEILSNATHSVDLMGRTMHSWTEYDELEALLIRRVREGVSFRWLIMGPANRFHTMLTEEGAELDSMLGHKRDAVLSLLCRVRDRLHDEHHPKFQIRVFDHVPLYGSVARFDETTYWSPYLCSNNSKNCPLLIVHGRNKNWAQLLDREFQSIWNRANIHPTNSTPENSA